MSRLPPILPVPSRPHRLDVRFLLFGPLPRRASLFVRRGSFDVGNNNFVIRPFSMEVHFQPLVAGGTLIAYRLGFRTRSEHRPPEYRLRLAFGKERLGKAL